MQNRNWLITIKWGAILGVGLSFAQLLRHYTKDLEYFTFAPIYELLLVLIFITALFVGIKEYRDRACQGIIKFPNAFLTGIKIIFVALKKHKN